MSTEHGLGVVVGSVNAVAAIGSGIKGRTRASDFTTVTRHASLRLAAGEPPRLEAGSALTGRHARDILVDGFVARVGDPVGILTEDGATYAGEDLMASAVECLVHEATAGESDPTIVVTHPTAWPRFTVDSLVAALHRAGLHDVTPVAEATAALQWLEATKGPLADGNVVVYDLGGSSLDIAVLRTGAGAGIVGKPIRSDDVCGAQFDHLTMQHVLSHVGEHAIDPFDPATEKALHTLRASCARGKEELSSETETALTVDLPGIRQQVRLVRGELEDLVREPLSVSMTLVREAVYAAGLELRDIDQVLLIGGGAAIPLVAETVSSDLGLAVVSSDRPHLVTAIGAAMLATDIGSAGGALDVARDAEPATEIIPTAARALAGRADAPVPALRAAAVAPLPVAEKPAMSRGKKAGFVAAAAVAITVLAAGGLSLGTGGSIAPQTPTAGQTSATTQAPTSPGAPVDGVPVVAGVDQPTGAAGQPNTTDAGKTESGTVANGGAAQSTGSPAVAGNSPAPAQPAPGGGAAAPAPAAPAPVQQQQPPAQTGGGGSAPAPQSPPAQSGGGGNNTPSVPDLNLPTINTPNLPNLQFPTASPVAPLVAPLEKLGG